MPDDEDHLQLELAISSIEEEERVEEQSAKLEMETRFRKAHETVVNRSPAPHGEHDGVSAARLEDFGSASPA